MIDVVVFVVVVVLDVEMTNSIYSEHKTFRFPRVEHCLMSFWRVITSVGLAVNNLALLGNKVKDYHSKSNSHSGSDSRMKANAKVWRYFWSSDTQGIATNSLTHEKNISNLSFVFSSCEFSRTWCSWKCKNCSEYTVRFLPLFRQVIN